MSEIILVELARLAGVFLAAWLGTRVEQKWLRADVNRAHDRLDSHDARIREVELEIL